jgi:pyruvate/2-oxoacid:ferredoxin oxidoreductase alpha subunit
MVNLEGFILSHTHEIVDIPEHNEIDRFLPAPSPRHCLDVENPSIMGATTDLYINFRYKTHQAMEKAKTVCEEVDTQFQRAFGRGYGLIQPYNCEDSDIILVTAGTIAGTSRMVADQYSGKGLKVGVLRIRLFRPFPKEGICEVLRNTKKVAVIDRDFSPGCGGILAQEIRSALQEAESSLPIYEFIAGLGGKDVTDDDVERIISHTNSTIKPEGSTWLGLLP